VDVAGQRAEAAGALLEEQAQARVVRAAVGAPDPLQAITDELRVRPGYDARWSAVQNATHAMQFKESVRSVTGTDVKFLTPDIAVAHVRWGRGRQGRRAAQFGRIAPIALAKKSGTFRRIRMTSGTKRVSAKPADSIASFHWSGVRNPPLGR
jgi:hypothetical protein